MTKNTRSKGLHISLWVVQILLAFAFGMAGFQKMTTPIEELAQAGMGFVNDYSTGMVRFIGVSELLGALGLILPGLLRFKPNLTVLAALGLVLIMVLAAIYHINHNESFLPNIVFMVLGLFVAWGRFKKAPHSIK